MSSCKAILAVVVAALLVVGFHYDWASAQDLTRCESADGRHKAYYAAGDEFLIAGLDLSDRYWSDVARTGRHLLRGHLDHYLPIALNSLEHEPANSMMRAFAVDFFSARHPRTGLIPFSYDSWLDEAQTMSTGGKQPVALIARGVEFCQWFPEDMKLQRDCLALAEDTIKHFDFDLPKPGARDAVKLVPPQAKSILPGQPGSDHGLWGWVDVRTGSQPRISLTLTQDYGAVATGLAYLSRTTGNPQLLQWSDRKLDFVWRNRMNPDLPLLNEQFVPTKGWLRSEEMSSDTDTLYYVRHLFDLYAQTGEPTYRDWAMAVTDLWYDKAWNPQWKHFVRKLYPDGTPAVDAIYGDGKYNTLAILIDAYEVSEDAKYIERFKLAFNNLLQMGHSGLVPEHLTQGKMVAEHGFDNQQTIFLDLLVSAYQASGDRELLGAAEELGKRILAEGESVMRIESGQAGGAFLHLALARREIKRLEVSLGRPGRQLTLNQDHREIFQELVPAEVAVVYLPAGDYELVVGNEGHGQSRLIAMDRNKHETID